ncbi:hypothetical protein [Zooshikella ganghwensis]|uniref:Lipoprotein n=1 Tax=Zooshikella ganghwensis TaxID=202772 RepID=A0A4P9VNJ5_9GAMM|nr:hypothetical protein [Zooshikella ganghwensis]RDH44037.1 hypothetical protein B9G39_11585 [Zooshikella ganghwensis]
MKLMVSMLTMLLVSGCHLLSTQATLDPAYRDYFLQDHQRQCKRAADNSGDPRVCPCVANRMLNELPAQTHDWLQQAFIIRQQQPSISHDAMLEQLAKTTGKTSHELQSAIEQSLGKTFVEAQAICVRRSQE